MFTGLIERTGKIVSKSTSTIVVDAGADFTVKVGDSVCVNGTCLTVRELKQNFFCSDVSYETFNATTFSKLEAGSVVNIERSMTVDGRFHGHIVTGHVDQVAVVNDVKKMASGTDVFIKLTDITSYKYLVAKGSVTVNGVSLTVNEVSSDGIFRITLIPHTVSNTNLDTIKNNDLVNIEFDVLSKYVEKLMFDTSKKISKINEEYLRGLGYE